MFIINTTFVTQTNISCTVLDWIKSAYIASALHCGAITEHTFIAKVLAEISPDTASYAVHACFKDKETAKKWCEGIGSSLRKKLSERWGEKAIAFHTYLEPIEL